MEGLRERQLSFDEKNFMKNAHTVFYNISLRACVPNATLNRNLLVGSWHVIFYSRPIQKCWYVHFDKKLAINEEETKL